MLARSVDLARWASVGRAVGVALHLGLGLGRALLAQDLGSQEGAHAKTGGKKRSAKTKVKISAAKKRRV